MDNLLINRIKFKVERNPEIYFSTNASFMYRKEAGFIKTKLREETQGQFQEWCNQNGVGSKDKVFFDFGLNDNQSFSITNASDYFFPKYLKTILIRYFLQKGFLVEEFPKIWDFCVYERKGIFDRNPEWGVYRKYGMLIRNGSREITVNIDSNHTLISIDPKTTAIGNTKGVTTEGKIKRVSRINPLPCCLVANYELLKQMNLPITPKRISYKEIYEGLMEFLTTYIKPFRNEYINIQASGFVRVNSNNTWRVSLINNKMLFGHSNVDINAITGMRDFGPYKPSPKALENRFIFIYENRDDANQLYQYLRNGYRHFPGLERYVKIPTTLDNEKKLKYSNINSLEAEFNNFIATKLKDANYENHFAIVIGPFDKVEADEKESHLYYYLKEQLLRKGISSQFIDYRNIRNSSVFHFHLPNIAIAILAKMGGIPWRLENKDYRELVIGFNQARLANQQFIGSAVFFGNDGNLGAINAFPQSNSSKALVDHLRNAIRNYLEQSTDQMSLQRMRLVIHYYKPYSIEEAQELERLLKDDLNLDMPYAIVEINDSKTHMDICFDEEYGLGMPESGRYVKTAYNEYLVFNNNRYEKKPLRTVSEELPIKVKVHFDSDGEFSHQELINQIYEFSRLYWKSLKQRSLPVTTIYSKLIAEFSAEYEGNLPQNNLTSTTPWFL